MSNDNGQGKDKEQKLEEINNRLVTTVGAKIYQADKGTFIQKASEQGRTPAAQIAHLIHRFNEDRLVTSEDQEQHKQDIEELRNYLQKEREKVAKLEKQLNQQPTTDQLDELDKQLKQIKKERDNLSKQVTDLNNQLEKAKSQTSKTDQEKQKQIDQLKEQLKQKESDRKSAASKRDRTKEQLDQANAYIAEQSQGVFGIEYKQF